MRKNRFLCLILPVLTIILELLPYGAVLNFAVPEGEPLRETYSYFSLTPFGYANFAPFLTAVITCVIFLLLVIYCITGRRGTAVSAGIILCVCTALSLAPLMFGIRNFSIVGALITASLVAELLLIYILLLKNK